MPLRQWVLSLPWELRLPVARDPVLLNAVSRVSFEEVREWLRSVARPSTGARVEAAAVTFVQTFDGSLNLNPHLHVLVAHGVFACREDGSSPEFMATPAPTREDLRGVIERLETIARRRGQREAVDAADEDGMEGLRRAAGGRVEADDRDALERLCRYMARPAVATGRVSVLPDGNVAYRVRSLRSGAATHRVMTPMEFMGRLAALVPPPRTPLVRYHGVMAPNSPWRVAVVPLPPGVAEVGGGRRRRSGRASIGRGCCGG